MNPLLALGQILVSIALIAAILLQARGTGLSEWAVTALPCASRSSSALP